MADLGNAGDEIVVFLIGMRINKPWKPAKSWPVFVAIPRMLSHLERHPRRVCSATDRPCYRLRSWSSTGGPSPIWKRFARDKDDPHLEPWRKFNRTVGGSGDVGIWHETYRVPTANMRRETIYGQHAASVGSAPLSVSSPVPGPGRETAAARLGGALTTRSPSFRVT